jgi:hypothetical protein
VRRDRDDPRDDLSDVAAGDIGSKGDATMKTKPSAGLLSRRRLMHAGASVAVLGAGAWALFGGTAPVQAETVSVVMSPYCGCCGEWAGHLERHGFRVEVEYREDVEPAKRRAGVPAELVSCHTAFVEGYAVEGHVPAPAIARMLAERPDLAGIAVPGMPADAPGMAGGGVMDVVGFRRGAATGLYMRARG